MPVASVVRWAGSKKKLLPFLAKRAPESYRTYYEPFCGSAALFCHLEPTHAVLGDINPELINALQVLRDNGNLFEQLKRLDRTESIYYAFRKQNPNELSPNDRAVRFLYLNRFCFNGVYRTNKLGEFNVPMGTSTGTFPNKESFAAFSNLLQNARLYRGGFTETLADASRGDFAYLDPPFTKHGTSLGEYGIGSFTDKDWNTLVATLEDLDRRGVSFLLSYKTNEEIVSQLGKKFEVEHLEVNRHVAGFKRAWTKATELLVRNYE